MTKPNLSIIAIQRLREDVINELATYLKDLGPDQQRSKMNLMLLARALALVEMDITLEAAMMAGQEALARDRERLRIQRESNTC